MKYTAKIRVPAGKIAKFDELLAKDCEDGLVESLGYPTDCMIDVYTAHFSNGWDADIKMCSGDANFFVDPVLFDEDGRERAVLDCGDEYEGTYTFEVDGDTYEVVVEGVAEPCAFLYAEVKRLDAIDTDWFGETRIFKSEEAAYAHWSRRRDELKRAGYEYANSPYRDCYVRRGDNYCVIPRVEPITLQ